MADLLADRDATALAELVRRREVTPAELLEAAIERLEAVNPRINAVVTKLYERARAEAAGELPDGAFTGVPFLTKDLLATIAGVRHTAGTAFQKDWVAPIDSELVRRLRRAGLVIFGVTNTPELGILPTTEPALFGPSRNPWDPSRTTGGSSGGSAAAVAAGVVPMAHGNDGGGSIRIPAACCGLFGLKPTRGRNPLGPVIGDIMHGLVVEHAITRSVRDSAALLDATEGADPGAPYVAPAKARPYAAEVGTKPGRLRIGWTDRAVNGAPLAAECREAMEDAASLCRELGHELVELKLDFDGNELTQAFLTLWAGGNAWTVEEAGQRLGKRPRAEDFEALTWAMYELGRSIPVVRYLEGLSVLQRTSRRIGSIFTEIDVALTPVLAQPPLPLGSMDAEPGNPMAGFFKAATFTPFTPMANMTGQPAMSVPLWWTPAGLPIGSHFIGRFGDEATLFRLAAQLEQARPWASRKPPIHAGP
jgi:amidase